MSQRMSRVDGPAEPAGVSALLPAALWFVTGLVAAAPAWLLLTFAESRPPQVAGTGLLVAGAVAFVTGAACVLRPSSKWLLPAGAVVVVLCAVAPFILEIEGRVSSRVLVGGAAAALAMLATVLTLFARPSGARR